MFLFSANPKPLWHGSRKQFFFQCTTEGALKRLPTTAGPPMMNPPNTGSISGWLRGVWRDNRVGVSFSLSLLPPPPSDVLQMLCKCAVMNVMNLNEQKCPTPGFHSSTQGLPWGSDYLPWTTMDYHEAWVERVSASLISPNPSWLPAAVFPCAGNSSAGVCFVALRSSLSSLLPPVVYPSLLSHLILLRFLHWCVCKLPWVSLRQGRQADMCF